MIIWQYTAACTLYSTAKSKCCINRTEVPVLHISLTVNSVSYKSVLSSASQYRWDSSSVTGSTRGICTGLELQQFKIVINALYKYIRTVLLGSWLQVNSGYASSGGRGGGGGEGRERSRRRHDPDAVSHHSVGWPVRQTSTSTSQSASLR